MLHWGSPLKGVGLGGPPTGAYDWDSCCLSSCRRACASSLELALQMSSESGLRISLQAIAMLIAVSCLSPVITHTCPPTHPRHPQQSTLASRCKCSSSRFDVHKNTTSMLHLDLVKLGVYASPKATDAGICCKVIHQFGAPLPSPAFKCSPDMSHSRQAAPSCRHPAGSGWLQERPPATCPRWR